MSDLNVRSDTRNVGDRDAQGLPQDVDGSGRNMENWQVGFRDTKWCLGSQRNNRASEEMAYWVTEKSLGTTHLTDD